MKQITRFFSVLCLGSCLAVGTAGAQEHAYRTRGLAELAGRLEKKGVALTAPGEHDASSVCPGKRVYMQKDLFGRVGAIGLRLFSDSLKRDFDRRVYDFAERYLLELLLCPSREEVLTRLKEDKVELTFNCISYTAGGWELRDGVAFLGDSLMLNVSTGSGCYVVDWRDDSRSFNMIFPMQYELIHGADKAEMEEGFMEELARAKVPDHARDTLPLVELQETKRKGYYARKGGVYLTNALHSATYYKAIDDQRATLFFDKALPGESLANLFLRGFCGERKLTLKITHHRYGNQKTLFEVDVTRFVAHCREQGCEIYFATEEMDGKGVKGTVLVQHRDLGYNHLLYFDCPMEAFDRLRPMVNVALYTYIPTHNVKNLFNDEPKKQ